SALAGGRVAGAVQALAGPVVLGAGVGTAAWLLRSSDPTPAQPPSRVVAQAKAAGAAVADRPVSDAAPELLSTVSGGARSSITPEEMGKHGRRFVHEAVPGTEITKTMGQGVDPIRVYAGLDSGATPQARVAKAMADAERLGAFDGSRDQVVLVTPTGSGFVDPPSIQAAEFMSRGRIASIAIQYADKPSIQSTGKVPLAAETTKLLAEAVKARVAQMPEGERPEVELFGESLGAWSQQEVFEGKGTAELDRLGIDRSLWVGSPNESGFASEAVRALGTAGNPGVLRQFDRIEEVDALDPAAKGSLRHVLLTHRNDPVSVVNKATLGFQRPDWLPAKGTPPNGIPASMHYVPGVSLAQGLVDLVNGTHPEPGKFEAHAHDYRADLPEFVRVAYGHDTPGEPDAVSDEQVAGITQELIQLERERAAILKRDPSW
ncbi:MAG: putative rane protein, partial [Thermoleophilia bacterium]|nr:putative rane protein [Thermoleophilia bacterium]